MAIKVNGNTVIYDDEVLRVSAANTSSRPASSVVGMIRFNTDINDFEGRTSTDWKQISVDEFTKTMAIIGL